MLSVDVVEAAMVELTERVTITNPALQFRVMDAADLHQLDDQSFDLVVDKGAYNAYPQSRKPLLWALSNSSLQRSGRGLPAAHSHIETHKVTGGAA